MILGCSIPLTRSLSIYIRSIIMFHHPMLDIELLRLVLDNTHLHPNGTVSDRIERNIQLHLAGRHTTGMNPHTQVAQGCNKASHVNNQDLLLMEAARHSARYN